jgi:hypothetical protein
MQHTIEIPELGKTLYMPSELSECDSRQYIAMCELITKRNSGIISDDDFRVMAVYKLLNLKPVESSNIISEQHKLSNIYLIAELIDSFFEVNESGQKIIKQFYIHNPVPKITPLWKTYYGPSDGFSNLTFGEYVDVLRLFLDFGVSGSPELLYDIVAILYREKQNFHFIRKRLNNYKGDCRISYNSNKVVKRSKAMQKAPVGFVYGVYLLFASFQKYLTTAKLPWGGQEIDLSILFTSASGEQSGSSNTPDLGMDSLVFSLAESGAFGAYSDVRNTGLWEILIRMYDLRKRDLDTIAQAKKNG